MKRVNQMRIYHLGKISHLRGFSPGVTSEEFFEQTASIAMQLDSFIENDEYDTSLPMAVERAGKLRNYLYDIYKRSKTIDENDIHTIDYLVVAFESSLHDELQRLHTYMVNPVGAYSFDRLIAEAERAFPENLRSTLIPQQASIDFRSAGACLAFALPTACGFHAFRAADVMIRAYYAHFVGTTPAKGPRDWGGYIRALRDAISNNPAKKPNPRTVALLDCIREMDRNPVIHPELDLDIEMALATFDLCKNAITLMAIDIRDNP